MDKEFIVKWASPARDDVNEIIDRITLTNEIYAVKILDKIEKSVKFKAGCSASRRPSG